MRLGDLAHTFVKVTFPHAHGVSFSVFEIKAYFWATRTGRLPPSVSLTDFRTWFENIEDGDFKYVEINNVDFKYAKKAFKKLFLDNLKSLVP